MLEEEEKKKPSWGFTGGTLFWSKLDDVFMSTSHDVLWSISKDVFWYTIYHNHVLWLKSSIKLDSVRIHNAQMSFFGWEKNANEIRGRHENKLIKSFEMSPHMTYLYDYRKILMYPMNPIPIT